MHVGPCRVHAKRMIQKLHALQNGVICTRQHLHSYPNRKPLPLMQETCRLFRVSTTILRNDLVLSSIRLHKPITCCRGCDTRRGLHCCFRPQVDAFTTQHFTGNPAAVCFLEAETAQTLNSKGMQAIAAEMNQPATCFVNTIQQDQKFETAHTFSVR